MMASERRTRASHDPRTVKATGSHSHARERSGDFLAGTNVLPGNRDEEVVEIGVRANDRQIPDPLFECDLIGGSTKFDIGAEEFGKFGTPIFGLAAQPHVTRNKA